MENHQPVYDRDKEHLRLLGIFHYIAGSICILFSSFGIIHIIMGGIIFFAPGAVPQSPNDPHADMIQSVFGAIFAITGSCVVLSGWTFGILTIISGRKMSRYRSRTYSLVIAGINCLWVPFGTILGVFTIIVLSRDSVIELYSASAKQSTSDPYS